MSHAKELESELRRAVYEAFARRRARHIAMATEVLLIVEASLLAWILPLGLLGFGGTKLAPITPTGLGSFLPSDSGQVALHYFWPSLAIIFSILLTQAWRNYSLVLHDLAEWYSTYQPSSGKDTGGDMGKLGKLVAHLRRGRS